MEDGLLEVSRQQETNSQACMDMCSKTRDDLQAKQSEDVAALKTQVDAQLEGVRLECQGVESRLQERVSQEVQVLESAQTKHRADSSAEVEKLSQQLQEVERRANALEQSSTKEAERLQAQLSLVEGKQSNLEEDVAPLVEKYTQDLQAKVGVCAAPLPPFRVLVFAFELCVRVVFSIFLPEVVHIGTAGEKY